MDKSNINLQDSKIVSALLSIEKAIIKMSDTVTAIPNKLPEILATIIYAISHLIMAIFHEPWFDEAVAWQIARCASIKEILFERPHYEGHPPLWHLILMPFAKLGAPYELSLTLVSLIFAGAAVGLIIWKSPFPRIVRLLLPFTYFFFYQYGVISRPYCVMMLAFVLLAMSYSTRNEKPLKYTLCMALLCSTSAYGIVISAGIAAVWLWEIWNKENIFKFIKRAFSDKRIYCLAGLLIFALVLIVGIIPREDTAALGLKEYSTNVNSLFKCLMYMLFALPSDVTITNIIENNYLFKGDLPVESLISGIFIGLCIWIIIFYIGTKKGTLKLIVIPYVAFSVFGSIVYLYSHHIGIGLLLGVFWTWINMKTPDNKTFNNKIIENYKSIFKCFATILFAIGLTWSLVWSVTSCVIDIKYSYAAGRNEAEFIKENGLDKYNIMVGWSVVKDEDKEGILAIDTNSCGYANNVAPYFDHNIFFNFNDGRDDMTYSTHKVATDEENQENFSKWSKVKPDVLFMLPELEMVYDEADLSMRDYVCVYSNRNHKVWKGTMTHFSDSFIFVRKDLVEEIEQEETDRGKV